MTMSWTGRELQSITKGNNTYSFTYNLDGLRTKKYSDGTNTFYYYDDSNNLIGLKKGNTTVLFYYDSNGQVYSMSKGEYTYFFIKNLQGDVMKIINENGATLATYVYDAWGALLSQSENGSIAGLSPFRYRSYVYDTDTELYYLQSRYYDPKIGRFINADSPEYTDTYSGSPLSTNMFAYCENNAVMGNDPTGNWNTKDHVKTTEEAGFSGAFYQTVRNWTYNADAYPCESTNDYSTPFHGRANAIEIGKKLYSLALSIKMNKRSLLFKIGKDERRYTTINFLKYQTKKGGSEEKTRTAQKAFINRLNSGDWNTQSQILLGLALHTLQDYFAHVIKVNLTKTTYTNYYAYGRSYSETNYFNNIAICMVDDMMGLPNSEIEDNSKVLVWRFKNATSLTKSIYQKWKNNKSINSLRIKKGKTTKYYITTMGSYTPLCAVRYNWIIATCRYDYCW